MIYKEKEQENVIVSQAWNRLYQRLDRDGLLPEKKDISTRHSKMDVERIRPVYHRLATTTARIAVAAALVGCLFVGWHLLRGNKNLGTEIREIVNEASSPTLATMLEDGSVVYLSAQTSLKYPNRFEEEKREVTLTGEAFFEIKKYAARPFIVITDIAEVEVTGTAFKIKSDQNTPFLLSVSEGTVRVTQKNRSEIITATVGETVFFDSERLHLRRINAEYEEFFKCIRFKDESLVDVIAIINKHSETLQLQIDPSIERRITFTFNENSPIDEVAEAICLAMNLTYSQQDSTIYISKPK